MSVYELVEHHGNEVDMREYRGLVDAAAERAETLDRLENSRNILKRSVEAYDSAILGLTRDLADAERSRDLLAGALNRWAAARRAVQGITARVTLNTAFEMRQAEAALYEVAIRLSAPSPDAKPEETKP